MLSAADVLAPSICSSRAASEFRARMTVAISALLSRGSGASVVHAALAARIPGYRMYPLDPRLEYCPPLLLAWRRHAAPIVHAPPDYAALVTPRRSRLVVTFHGYFLDAAFRPLCSPVQRLHYASDLRWFVRRGLARADIVTAVSQYVADLIREDLAYRGEIHVISNGIDTEHFARAPKRHEGVRVLYCGNLSRRKGGDLLAAIAAQLAPGIELWIASGLRDDRARNELPPNCRLLGRVAHEQMPALYNDADIVLAPSRREGFGLSIVEGMACGLPVVASNCSAIPELVVDNVGGLLAEPGNAEDFATKLTRLAGDPALRRQMGDFNRARVLERYEVSSMVSAYERLFARCSSTAEGG